MNEKLPNPETDKRDILVYTAKETDPVHGFKNGTEVVFHKEVIRGKARWVLQTPIVMHTDLD